MVINEELSGMFNKVFKCCSSLCSMRFVTPSTPGQLKAILKLKERA